MTNMSKENIVLTRISISKNGFVTLKGTNSDDNNYEQTIFDIKEMYWLDGIETRLYVVEASNQYWINGHTYSSLYVILRSRNLSLLDIHIVGSKTHVLYYDTDSLDIRLHQFYMYTYDEFKKRINVEKFNTLKEFFSSEIPKPTKEIEIKSVEVQKPQTDSKGSVLQSNTQNILDGHKGYCRTFPYADNVNIEEKEVKSVETQKPLTLSDFDMKNIDDSAKRTELCESIFNQLLLPTLKSTEQKIIEEKQRLKREEHLKKMEDFEKVCLNVKDLIKSNIDTFVTTRVIHVSSKYMTDAVMNYFNKFTKFRVEYNRAGYYTIFLRD